MHLNLLCVLAFLSLRTHRIFLSSHREDMHSLSFLLWLILLLEHTVLLLNVLVFPLPSLHIYSYCQWSFVIYGKISSYPEHFTPHLLSYFREKEEISSPRMSKPIAQGNSLRWVNKNKWLLLFQPPDLWWTDEWKGILWCSSVPSENFKSTTGIWKFWKQKFIKLSHKQIRKHLAVFIRTK